MTLSIHELKQFSLLNVFTDEELMEIRRITRFHDVKKDETLFLEGESTNALYFVLDGWLKAEKVSREGRQQTLRFIGPGEIINELSVFANRMNFVSVIAMERGQVFSISQSDVEEMLVTSPLFSRAVILNLTHRIEHLLNHIENLSLYPVEVRLARLLLEDADDGVVIRQSWKTQSEIAGQLGTVMDVVNRHLQNMAKRGYIEINRDEIIILNHKGLGKIAKG